MVRGWRPGGGGREGRRAVEGGGDVGGVGGGAFGGKAFDVVGDGREVVLDYLGTDLAGEGG